MNTKDILQNTVNGKRLQKDEAIHLYYNANLYDLANAANEIREKIHGDKTYFIRNKHIDYSNVCILRCRFCAFARKPKEEGAFEYSVEDILNKIRESADLGLQEVHIVGGFHPKLPLEFYTDMMTAIKKEFPQIHIKAFTAAEIHYFSRKFKKTQKEIIELFQASGWDSMPGGGAEILEEETRKIICGPKGTGEVWLNTHELVHSMGMRSNATMLYGHVEKLEDRIYHMDLVRQLQDKTKGFLSFIPLAFNPKGTEFEVKGYTTGFDDLRTLAISRLYFDNIKHIKAYWVMSGTETSQLAQHFGADDLHGTVVEENIVHMAGATSPQEYSVRHICKSIWDAGRIPVERDSLYNEIKTYNNKASLVA